MTEIWTGTLVQPLVTASSFHYAWTSAAADEDDAFVAWVPKDPSGTVDLGELDSEDTSANPIALTATDLHVFWAQDNNRIHWIQFDTRAERNQNAGDGLNAIAADQAHVYWANMIPEPVFIERRETMTSSKTRVVQDQPSPTEVLVTETQFIWANIGAETAGGGADSTILGIDKADITGDIAERPIQLFARDVQQPTDMVADDEAIYWVSDPPSGPGGVFKVAK